MKLRIRGNSLRLRLSQREVTDLAAQGRVEDAIAFPPVGDHEARGAGPASRMVYALQVSDDAPAPFAHLEGARIDVTLPASVAREWTSTDQVGIEAEQPLGDGGVLRILVEKDFACLKPRTGEDDADAYPNPSASK